MINPKEIRKDFPIFENNPNLIYFDNTATTQKPKQVIEKIKEVYEKYYANIHRGVYKISEISSEEYENSHKLVADFIKCKEWREIIFTRNTTESINLVAYSYGLNNINKDDKILISYMEHSSNLLPWRFVCKKTGAKLEYINVKDYRLDLNDFERKIDEKTKIVSITHVSNVLGTINPIEEIIKIAHEKGALVLIDAAQSSGHLPIDVKKLDVDFLVFSSHKMLGPSGIGILYGKEELLENMEPFLWGGDMIKDIDFDKEYLNDLPWKFEAGTPNIADGIAFGEAIKYLNKLGMENIEKYEQELTKYFLERFEEFSNKYKDVILMGLNDYKDREAIFSLVFKMNPHIIGKMLDSYNITVRTGYHCCYILFRHLDLYKYKGSVRASLYIYNTKEEIDFFFEKLEEIVKRF
ncbi:MAG: aminotransferase class V-fold PLP-dependent enzyme [Candidatus Nanopusillus sp.]|jgi:cysteine desulfurase/selenocysteine lyase